jgi:hypothetical protein
MICKLSEAEKTVHDVKTLVDRGERALEITKSRCREENAGCGQNDDYSIQGGSSWLKRRWCKRVKG